ncbi:MAG: response regulator transcription factor [Acidobacteriia bacterium]|nr:response regulator transcription factor [Terriglobia bacterium]
MPNRVVLVDDHKIMRDGIKAILSHTEDFKVVGEAESGTAAVETCQTLRPDIVVMDIGLPGWNGIEATIEILRLFPETKVVILSMYDDAEAVFGAMDAGARAFVLKKGSDTELLKALSTVAEGGTYLCPQVSEHLLRRVQPSPDARSSKTALKYLSPRELEVLRLIAEGNTGKAIAASLALSPLTVRSYRKTLMRKLGVSNIAGLTQIAIQNHVVRTDAPLPARAKSKTV